MYYFLKNLYSSSILICKIHRIGVLLIMEENIRELKMEDEIDLKELLLLLWKKKILIITIALLAAILTGIVSVFFIEPVYHSKLNIIINMPETYHTKYGDYTLPITTNEQYINLICSNDILARTIKDMGYDDITIESLRERIIIESTDAKTNVDQNIFNIKVAANNPEEARKLAQTLYDNYSKFIDLITIEGAVDYYINKYSVELSSLAVSLNRTKEILAKNEVLLSQTPQTINQREAMDEINDSPRVSDYVILENIINPNYTEIENDIIENKQSIDNIENTIAVYNQYMEELNIVKENITDCKYDGKWNITYDEFKSIAKTNLYLPSAPITPSHKSSPHILKNVILGTLIGGIIGVGIVFIKDYWLVSK